MVRAAQLIEDPRRSTEPGAHIRCVLLLLMLTLAMLPTTISAAPELSRTMPLDGEVLQRTPSAVAVAFDEPINPALSTLTMLDIHGNTVEGTSLAFDPTGTGMTLRVPSNLPDGVYTLIWHAVSATDGAVTQSWSSFSVGVDENAVAAVQRGLGEDPQNGNWLQATSRTLALIGIVAAMAVWPVWRAIIRPSVGGGWRRAVPITLRIQQFAIITLVVAAVGSVLELLARAQSHPGVDFIDRLMSMLGHTDWGFWWLTRMVFIVLLGVGLSFIGWWFPRRHPVRNIVLWILTVLITLPIAFSSHAWTEGDGLATTVAFDAVHMLMAGLWGGGVLVLAWMAPVILRRERNAINLGNLARRFGWLSLVAWFVLAVTGLHAADVHVGNIAALLNTAYGMALIGKIALTLIAIALTAIIIRSLATRHPDSRLGRLTVAQAAMLVGILLTVGRLNTAVPARQSLEQDASQTSTTVSISEQAVPYLVAPGNVGMNHLLLEIPSTLYLSSEATVLLDITPVDRPELGMKTIQFFRITDNNFEHIGAEFSLPGSYDLTLRVADTGADEQTFSFSQSFGDTSDALPLPADAWTFGPVGGLGGLALLTLGAAGIGSALFTAQPRLRVQAGGLGVASIALAAVVLATSQVESVADQTEQLGVIDPNDSAMVARGQDLYGQYCVTCHGADLRGTGPISESLIPPATDFGQPHAMVHTDEQMVDFVRNGVPPSAMPGFNSQLSDEDIRSVVAYLQNWQEQFDPRNVQEVDAEGNPIPAAVCEVSPLRFEELPTLFHHGLMPETRRGTPLVRAADAEVGPDQTDAVMWTVEQMVGCANEDTILSQLRLYTPMMLQEIYPGGLTWELTSETTSPAEPLAQADLITVEDVQSVTMLADGRVAVSIIFDDPAGHGIVPNANPISQVTLVLVQGDDAVWYIDEIR